MACPPCTGAFAARHATAGQPVTRAGSVSRVADPHRRPLPRLGRPAARPRHRAAGPLLRCGAATTGCASRRSPGSTWTCSARTTRRTGRWTGRCGSPGYKTASYTVQRPLLFGPAWPAPTPTRRSIAAYTPLRAGRRRGVPAPRRPARRLRRPGGHRQAGRRRPAHRQADRAADARPPARHAAASGRRWTPPGRHPRRRLRRARPRLGRASSPITGERSPRGSRA